MEINNTTKILRDKRTKMINNFLKNYNLNGKRILDIGCEYGSSLVGITKNNNCFGVDSNKNALKIAKRRGIKTIYRNLNEGLPFKNSFFDVVIITSVLEHLSNPIKMIEEIKRVIKKDGSLVISLPNDFEIIRRFKFLILGRDQNIDDALNSYTHLHMLSISQWERFISKHFKIKEFYNESRISHLLAKIYPNLFSIEKIWICKIK